MELTIAKASSAGRMYSASQQFQMSIGEIMESKRELIEKLSNAEGTLDQAEHWLAQLKEQDPYFEASDRMLHLEDIVLARRALVELEKQLGDKAHQMNKAELIGLVEEIIHAEGTEAENDARIMLLEKNIVFPGVTDLIYHQQPELTPEEIVEIALAYKPIQL